MEALLGVCLVLLGMSRPAALVAHAADTDASQELAAPASEGDDGADTRDTDVADDAADEDATEDSSIESAVEDTAEGATEEKVADEGARAEGAADTALVPMAEGDDLVTWISDDPGHTWEGTNAYGNVVLTGYHGTATDVVVPDVVTTTDGNTYTINRIGTAFTDNTSITSVTLKYTVTQLAPFAFSGCTNLAHFAYEGDGDLASIPGSCFENCTSLTRVTIPGCVEAIGLDAFAGCTGLTSVSFQRVPQLTTIGDGAFSGCIALKTVEDVPETLVEIGARAFEGCENLETFSFVYLDRCQLKTIGEGAFKGCTALKELTLPFKDGSVSTVGSGAFEGCTGMEKLGFRHFPHGGNSASDAFAGCTGLKYVLLFFETKDIEKELGDDPLGLPEDAVYLVTRFVGSGDDATLSIDQIFLDINLGASTPRQSLDLVIPASFMDYDITVLGKGACSNKFAYGEPDYSGLRSVSFEEGCKITTIGEGAFNDCTTLQKVTIPPSVETIGKEAFSNCEQLGTLDFQTTSYKVVEPSTFYYCNELRNIVLPEGVTTVSEKAFDMCAQATHVYFPSTIEEINDDAFINCGWLHHFHMPDADTPIAIGEQGFWHRQGYDECHFYVTAGSWFDYYAHESPERLERIWYTPVDLSDPTVDFAIDESVTYTYNTQPQMPSLTAQKRWFHTLEEDSDYTIDLVQSSCTNAGKATVVITALDNGEQLTKFSGSRTIEFDIAPVDIAGKLDIWYLDAPDGGCYYDYKRWTPDAVFVCHVPGDPPHATMMEKDVDYTLPKDAYQNNLNAGTATITVNGQGNYTGTCEVSFPVRMRDLSEEAREATVQPIPDQVYTGEEICPEPEVSVKTRTQDTLVLGPEFDDYTLDYENNVDVTEPGAPAYVILTGCDVNVKGTRKVPFNIVSADIADVTVQPVPDQPYTGSAIEPELSMTFGEHKLVLGDDYEVAWKDNVQRGTATGTVTGKGPRFTGELEVSFQIVCRLVTVKADDLQVTYGDPIPTLTATVEGCVAGETVAYELSREPGEDAGTYAITVEGDEEQGNYTVTYAPGTLTITRKSLQSASVEELSPVTYDGAAWEPVPAVSLDGKVLVVGADYTTAYQNNVYADQEGSPSVTIVGAGNYEGTLEGLGFAILPCDLSGSDCTADVGVQRYTGSALEPELSRVSAPGRDGATLELAAGTDYEVVRYDNNVDPGTGSVTIRGIGNFCGERTAYFLIMKDPDFEDADVHAIPDRTYDGTAQEPVPVVTLGDAILVAGVDFEASYASNVNAGTATVTLTGKGELSGSITCSFTINPRAVTVTADDAGKTYGEDDPTLTATVEGTVGNDTVAYLLSRAQGEAPDDYHITAKGEADQGNYWVSFADGIFRIEPASLSAVEISSVADVTYDGTRQMPEPVLSYRGTTLEKGTDYEFSWGENREVGKASVTVAGKGGFRGERTVDFQILPRPVTVSAVTTSKAYGDDDPELTATVEGTVGSDTVTYRLSRAQGEAPGDYAITVTSETDQGNYQVTYANATFTIRPADLSQASVSGLSDVTFDGSAWELEPVVTWRGTTLVAGTDYTVSYEGNLHAGTATVTMRGMGNFDSETTVEGNFVINPFDISACDVVLPYQIHQPGDVALQPYPRSVTAPGRNGATLSLVEGTDYEVTDWRDNMLVGTGYATIEGKGDFCGSREDSFNILDDGDLDQGYLQPDTIEDQTYTGKPIEPTVRPYLKGNDMLLLEGVGYEVSYADNVDTGTATVTVTGIEPLYGILTTSFTILPADISTATVTVADQTYGGTGLEPAPTVTWNGMTLEAGKDYDVSYDKNIHVGTATVIVTGRGNFDSETTATGSFKIEARSLTVTAGSKDKVYDGKQLEAEGFSSAGLADGDTLAATVRGSLVDVGTAAAVASGAKVVNADGEDVTSDYDISYEPGVLEVTKRTVTLTSADATREYDGLPLASDAIEVSGDGWADGEGATYDVTGSRTITGTSKNSFTYTLNEGTKAGNYEVKTAFGTLTVTDRTDPFVVTMVSRSAEATFDGTEKAISGFEETSFDVPSGSSSFAVVIEGLEASVARTDAGTSPNAISGTAVVRDAEGNDVTVQFDVRTKEGSLVIAPADLAPATVSVDDQTYAGTVLEPAPTVTLGSEELVAGRDYSVSYEGNRHVGTATVTVAGTGNYAGEASGTFEIAPTGLTATYLGEAIAWDGTPALVVEVAGFVGDDDATTAQGYLSPTVTAPALVPGGSFELEPAGGAADDYTFSYVAGTLTVGLRPVESDPVAQEGLTYDGASQTGVSTGDGYSLDGATATDAGSYVATATLDEGWSWSDGTTGDRQVTWSIAPVSVSAATIEAIDEQTYTGGAVEPYPTVTMTLGKGDAAHEITLVAGTDYELVWSDNVEPGTATVTILGMGNYAGHASAHFAIVMHDVTYQLVRGPSGEIVKGGGETAEFTFKRSEDDDAAYGLFVGVMVDGKRLEQSSYSARKGSVVITLKSAYLDTLSAGRHTLRAVFEDGTADASFTVAERTKPTPPPTPTPTPPPTPTRPTDTTSGGSRLVRTGDLSLPAGMLAGVAGAGVGLTLVGVLLRRRRS